MTRLSLDLNSSKTSSFGREWNDQCGTTKSKRKGARTRRSVQCCHGNTVTLIKPRHIRLFSAFTEACGEKQTENEDDHEADPKRRRSNKPKRADVTLRRWLDARLLIRHNPPRNPPCRLNLCVARSRSEACGAVTHTQHDSEGSECTERGVHVC